MPIFTMPNSPNSSQSMKGGAIPALLETPREGAFDEVSFEVSKKEEECIEHFGHQVMLGAPNSEKYKCQNEIRNNVNESRFKDAQRNRTLRHHNLIQPTTFQEKVHLARIKAEQQIEFSKQSKNEIFDCMLPLSPKEEEYNDDDIQDERAAKSNISLEFNSMERVARGEIAYSAKRLSKTSTASFSTFTSCFTPSSRSNSDASAEESLYSPESPTTTLFVPEEKNCWQKEPKLPKSRSTIHTNRSIFLPNKSTLASSPPLPSYYSPVMFSPTYNDCEIESRSPTHRFVICADTKFGITNKNHSWDTEAKYSQQAVDLINQMHPRPSFVCICGDLVNMEYSNEKSKGSKSEFTSALFSERRTGMASREVCDTIQDEQNVDFKKIWNGLHPDIALVCLCGDHDVGNRPTPRSISRFRASFGDDYLAFWTNGTYNIFLNSVLFIDPTGAMRLYETQLRWLEDQLKYAHKHRAKQIYVFAHHPWFLYEEDEDPAIVSGAAPCPVEWLSQTPPSPKHSSAPSPFPGKCISIPKRYRTQALELFRKYGVNACFSGHYNQNIVSQTTWGMDMVITAPLSDFSETHAKKQRQEEHGLLKRNRQMDEVNLEFENNFLLDPRNEDAGEASIDNTLSIGSRQVRTFTHADDVTDLSSVETNSTTSMPEEATNIRGVRVVNVQVHRTHVDSGFTHYFIPS